MAYIPPHKRHSGDRGRPSPTPELLVPQFKKGLNFRSPDSRVDRTGEIFYADSTISRWFVVGLDEEGNFPSYVHCKLVSLEFFERIVGEKPLILVNRNLSEGNSHSTGNHPGNPWASIAENVKQDLVASFEILRNQMEDQRLEKIKLTLVARFCKILFHGSPSVRQGSVGDSPVAETTVRQLKRSIHTNIPPAYMENITHEVVAKIGLKFEDEKNVYQVKLSDKTRPDSTISCKCIVKEDGNLLLYKVELNQVRQMVTDISCLDKDLDLRLMLCTKRILTSITDDEMNKIANLIHSAILDSDVKGGLRWPLGKASSGDRYDVVGVGHTITKAYINPSLRLKVRHADRFDFRTGTGEATREAYLKLKGVVSELKNAGSNSVTTMLKENLKLIWENFLCCEHFLA